jgi:hypothetical protein
MFSKFTPTAIEVTFFRVVADTEWRIVNLNEGFREEVLTYYRRNKKKNLVVQKTYYITGQVEDTQEEQLGKFK